MESNEFATQTASAEVPESAPVVNEVPETVAPDTQEETAVVQESAPVTEPAEPEMDKRTKELIAQRKKRQEAERDAAYWKGVAEARAAQTAPEKPVVNQNPDVLVKPQLENFDTYEAFEEANTEYTIRKAEQMIAKRMAAQQQEQTAKVLQRKFDEVLQKEIEKDPIVLDAVNTVGRQISPEVGLLIKQSDQSVGVVKHLFNNPKELQKIAAMHPLLAAKEIGAIEVALRNKPKPTPPKTVSAAPAPVATVNAESGPVAIDDDDLPIAEYIKRKNKVQFGR